VIATAAVTATAAATATAAVTATAAANATAKCDCWDCCCYKHLRYQGAKGSNTCKKPGSLWASLALHPPYKKAPTKTPRVKAPVISPPYPNIENNPAKPSSSHHSTQEQDPSSKSHLFLTGFLRRWGLSLCCCSSAFCRIHCRPELPHYQEGV
jgi:hypothetical protein